MDYDKVTILEMPEEGPICDFCSNPVVAWSYPAKDMSVATILTDEDSTLLGSDGEWLACEECAKLIESKDREGLVTRALKVFPNKEQGSTFPEALTKAFIESIYESFWSGRFGERKRIGGNA